MMIFTGGGGVMRCWKKNIRRSSGHGRLIVPVVLALLIPGARAQLSAVPPTISSGCEVDYPPFCMVQPDGQADGFSVELMRAALQVMGREVTFRTGTWEVVKGWLERRDVTALPLVGRTPEREALFDFTVPYLTMHGAIVVRNDTVGIQGLQDLRGRRVAVMKGDNAEEFLRREDRGLEIRTTPSFLDAFRDLSEGRCDAVVVQRLVALRLLSESGHMNLRILDAPVMDFRQDFCFAVPEGDRDTLALLNEGLALIIANGTYRRLHAKWFAALELPSNRRIMVGGDRNYPPFEFLKESGVPAGFCVDIAMAVALASDLNIEIRLGSWAENVEALKSGKLDVLSMFYTPERGKVLDFSMPYMVSHCVAVVRRDGPRPPATMAELRGHRLVVEDGDIMHQQAIANGLDEWLYVVNSQEDALREVKEGRRDCALVSRTTALSVMTRAERDSLVVGRTPLFTGELCFAVAKGNKALLASLNEGLHVIKESGDYRQIFDRWMGVYETGPPAWRVILKYVLFVAVPLLVIALLALAWSWTLRRKVARRTADLTAHYRLLHVAGRTARFGGWSVDLALNQCTWSDVVADIHGMPPGFSPSVEDAIHFYAPEWREKITQIFRACAEKGVPFDEVMQVITRTGQRVWVRTTGEAVRNQQGEVVQVQGSFQDVSERKRVEEALRESEERHRALIEGLPDIVMRHDREGRHLFVSDNIAGMTGLSADAFIGKTHRELGFTEDLCELFENAIRQVFNGGTAVEKEFSFKGIKGETIFNWRLVPEFDADHQIVSVLTISRDITEHRRTERDYQTLFREMLDGFALHEIICDKQGRPVDYRFLAINPAFERMTGLKAEAVTGRTVLEIMPGTERHWIETYGKVALTGEPAFFENYAAMLGKHFEVTAFRPAPNQFACIFMDITARKREEETRQQLQAQLLQSQKLESIGMLASGVAHEVNNPIMGIMNYAQLLIDRADGGSDSGAYAAEIIREANRVADIVRNLLSFARQDNQSFSKARVSDIVSATLSLIQAVIRHDQIVLEVEVPGDLPELRCRSQQIQQVLVNLLTNARDALNERFPGHSEQKIVRIEARKLERDGRGWILLIVEDHGAGISETIRDRIFDPFATTKHKDKGSGLGLSISHGIVTRHGGTIRYETESGKGTRFLVELPLDPGAG